KVRGVVGGHRERLEAKLPAPNDPDQAAEGGPQKVVPLAHQIERRRDDERTATLLIDGHDRHVALAGSGGEHDDAAPGRGEPRGDRLALVGARRALDPELLRELDVRAGPIFIVYLGLDQRANDLAVGDGGGPMTAGAGVVPAELAEQGVFGAPNLDRTRHER